MSDTKIVGLDLLRNPKNTRKRDSAFSLVKKKVDSKPPVDNDSIETKFKKHMIKAINEFKLPLELYEKNDPIKIHLESCWYFYNKNNS